jgi:hypothetical protein
MQKILKRLIKLKHIQLNFTVSKPEKFFNLHLMSKILIKKHLQCQQQRWLIYQLFLHYLVGMDFSNYSVM